MTEPAIRTSLHRDQPVFTAGERLSNAWAAMVLIHGRGASASDILLLGEELYHPQFAYLAPQAAGNTWYPYSFLAPIRTERAMADLGAGDGRGGRSAGRGGRRRCQSHRAGRLFAGRVSGR